MLKTAGNLPLLVLIQELGSTGVVVHVEKGDNGDDKGEKTLEDKDPLPAVKASESVHQDDTTSE